MGSGSLRPRTTCRWWPSWPIETTPRLRALRGPPRPDPWHPVVGWWSSVLLLVVGARRLPFDAGSGRDLGFGIVQTPVADAADHDAGDRATSRAQRCADDDA